MVVSHHISSHQENRRHDSEQNIEPAQNKVLISAFSTRAIVRNLLLWQNLTNEFREVPRCSFPHYTQSKPSITHCRPKHSSIRSSLYLWVHLHVKLHYFLLMCQEMYYFFRKKWVVSTFSFSFNSSIGSWHLSGLNTRC